MHVTCALLLDCEESIDYCSCLKRLECVSSEPAKRSLDFLQSPEVCQSFNAPANFEEKKNALIFHKMFYIIFWPFSPKGRLPRNNKNIFQDEC